MKLKRNYMKLIGIGTIVDSNYIGKRFCWVNPRSEIKGKKPIQFFRGIFLSIKILERLTGWPFATKIILLKLFFIEEILLGICKLN